MLPDVVGACLEDERHDGADGDGLQRTTGGLLVWRKATNTVAFTDGFRSWVQGPHGLQRRLNTERFDWEGGALPSAAPAPGPAAPAHAGRTGPRSVLAGRRLLTYYGNPWAPQLGVLGELPKAELVRELRRVAGVYERFGGRPVQPAIHLIATVAQAGPGPDGLYRARMPAAVVDEYARLAADNGLLLILDVQVGRSTVRDEVAPYLPYLARPDVHLALDPEFAVGPGERPGETLGGMDARAVNEAVRTLADLAASNDLPNKVLIVHQFAASMLTNKAAIQDDPRVDLVLDMDGFGGPAVKTRHYGLYVRDQAIEFAGIKLFYRHDHPLMAPEDVLGLDPAPDVVIYQ
jgi:hypothetical protein